MRQFVRRNANIGQCPTQIGRRHGIKNMAAIALQRKANVKLYSCLVLHYV